MESIHNKISVTICGNILRPMRNAMPGTIGSVFGDVETLLYEIFNNRIDKTIQAAFYNSILNQKTNEKH